MELRVLRYFVESMRCKSITRAAEKLHVTQPTLSRQLKELEDELGQKLFERSGYGIVPTSAGEILLNRASDILDLADKTENEFHSMKEYQGGDVYIGCAESEGMRIIARAVADLRQRHPRFRVHIHSGNAETVIDLLEKGLLDFAVVVQEFDLSRYGVRLLTHRDTWGLVIRKDSPLASMREIPVEALAGLPLIVSAQGITPEMPEWFRENGERLNIVATYNLVYNASILVGEGVGVALTLSGLVASGPESVLCFRPISPTFESPLRIIWSRQKPMSRSAELLLNEVGNNCGEGS